MLKKIHSSLLSFSKQLGPGLVWAATAIGVSHLVQSTSAGAQFGYYLIAAILLANALKYPFFSAASIYTSHTKESILAGYQRMNPTYLYLFTALILITMVIVQSAVTYVCAAILSHIIPIPISVFTWVVFLMIGCTLLLWIGGFNGLENTIKIILLLLIFSTCIAVILSFFKTPFFSQTVSLNQFDWGNHAHIVFLIALIGWMPCPLDFSAAHSLCILEKKQQQQNFTLKKSIFDFRVGYILTTVLALCFLVLGAHVMYGSGEVFSPKGAVFASQLIDLYTRTLGNWSYPLIAIAAFTVMFSTVITCLDLYPRMLVESIRLIQNRPSLPKKEIKQRRLLIALLAIGTLIFLTFFTGNMKSLITLATTLSFFAAPILAYFNYKLLIHPSVAATYPVSTTHRWFMLGAIIIMCFFSIIYWAYL